MGVRVASTSRFSAEDLFSMQLQAAGLTFERQYAYVPGRSFRADFALVASRLLVEVQGGIWKRQAHGSVSGVLKDNERLNEATCAGWRLIRVRPDEVDSGEAFALVERTLRAVASMEVA